MSSRFEEVWESTAPTVAQMNLSTLYAGTKMLKCDSTFRSDCIHRLKFVLARRNIDQQNAGSAVIRRQTFTILQWPAFDIGALGMAPDRPIGVEILDVDRQLMNDPLPV